ncbi:trigger factor [Vulgatibacter incomptus]|uniref:Trigger factor n=1 Tax=Vulgatibacter incomptus TaxID=1391653 RepID=A0A0K1PAU7_9BACT|nr:trigger factor [Vulgatibacter incomptus]AKU90224.1 Cell division trigger factor [Vulgatibacter incomptus]
MKVNVESLSPIEIKVSVQVEADRVATEIERAYKGLSRQVKIPGFRAGKVPRRILETRYKDEVEQDVARKLIDTTFREAVDQHDLFPVASPVVSSDRLEPGKDFHYEARVEVKPEVTAKDYKGLEIAKAKAEVTEAMVDDELERIREQLAQFVPVEDRTTATTGDYAVIDYLGTHDGKEIEGGKGQDITVKVDAGTLLEGCAPEIAGVAVGETAETTVEFPPDYPVESVRGTAAKFAITLKSLKKREVPALDDELAKDLGGEAKTLAELKAKIREGFEKSEKARAERVDREALLKALVAKNPIEVPKGMVDRAIDQMIQGTAERLQRQGVDIRKLQLDVRKLREDLREEATTRVKSALLIEAVGKQESLTVGDDELEAEYTRMSEELDIPVAKVRAHFAGSAAERSGLKQKLLEDKTVALIERESKVSG